MAVIFPELLILFLTGDDRSVDLWKTIKVWLDQIEEHPDLLNSCRFLIVTTQLHG